MTDEQEIATRLTAALLTGLLGQVPAQPVADPVRHAAEKAVEMYRAVLDALRARGAS